MAESTDTPVVSAVSGSEPQFVTEAGQLYSCRDCPAKCCRLPWRIDVTAEEQKRLTSVPWIVDYLKERNVDLMPMGDSFRMPRVKQPWGDYTCVFLGEDNRCVVHAREGHEILPSTCKVYPFGAFVGDYPAEGEDRPVKLYPVTSMFCKSINDNYGEPVTDLISQKYSEYLESKKVLRLQNSISIGGIAINKSSYLVLGEVYQELFAREDMTIPQALWQGRRLAWKIMLAGYDQKDLSPKGIRDIADAFFADPETRQIPEAPPRTLTGRALVGIDLVPYLLHEIVRERYDLDGSGAGFELLFIKLLLQVINDQGTYRVWNLPEPVNMAEAVKVSLDEDDPAFQNELRRYYKHLFFTRYVFLRDPDFLRTYFHLGATYPKILKVARWMAYSEGQTRVGLQHMRDAIGYADARFASVDGKAHTMLLKAQDKIYDFLSTSEASFLRLMLSESY